MDAPSSTDHDESTVAAVPAARAAPDRASRSTAAAAAELGSDLQCGLASAEATARLARYGRNEVAEEKQHPLRRFCASSGDRRRG